MPFTRELYIEQDDFREDPPKNYYRLAPGTEVRLRYAYLVTCVGVVKDDAGQITEVHCTYDPDTRGGTAPDGRRVRGTIHWVSAPHSVPAEVRLYDRLFLHPEPGREEEGVDFTTYLNPESVESLADCRVEPSFSPAPRTSSSDRDTSAPTWGSHYRASPSSTAP